jgi:hypothetical protein
MNQGFSLVFLNEGIKKTKSIEKYFVRKELVREIKILIKIY